MPRCRSATRATSCGRSIRSIESSRRTSSPRRTSRTPNRAWSAGSTPWLGPDADAPSYTGRPAAALPIRGCMLKEAEFGPNLLRHWIDRAAERDPDKAYIVSVDDRRTISYGQLRRLTRQIATFLAGRGIRTNDRIALLAGNSIEHLACYIGVMAYGATICTIHVEINRGHLAQILPTLNPRLAVFDEELELDDVLGKILAPCLPLQSFNGNANANAGFYKSVGDCQPTDVN